MNNNFTDECLEKLGALLRTVDRFELPEWDKSTLIWIACEYFDRLEKAISEVEKQ